MINFKGKKILVTGASSGIGRQTSIALSELGALVVLIGRDEDRLKQSISLMQDPAKHSYFCYDLGEISGIGELVNRAIGVDGVKFDGFVHCAGVPAICPTKVLSLDFFEEVFRVNTFSYIEIIKHLCKKQNSNDKASIVYVSSIMTKMPKKAQLAYIASKAAGESVQKVLSLEYEKRRIRFNAVISGGVHTKMVDDVKHFQILKDDSKTAVFSKESKILSTKEISNMILFLLSDSASFIVGESYFIDGGGRTDTQKASFWLNGQDYYKKDILDVLCHFYTDKISGLSLAKTSKLKLVC